MTLLLKQTLDRHSSPSPLDGGVRAVGEHDGGGTGRFPKIFEFKAKMQPSTFSFETRGDWWSSGRACAEGTRNAKIADAASRDSREN